MLASPRALEWVAVEDHLVCLVTKFFDPKQQGTCVCEDCNLSGELNAAGAPCITLCAFGTCATGRVGAGYDPCTALQVRVELHPGEEKIVAFVLGSGNHASDAQALALRYTSVDAAQRALGEVLRD